MRILPKGLKCSLRVMVQTPYFASLTNFMNLKELDIITDSLGFLPEIWNIWTIYYLAQKTILG